MDTIDFGPFAQIKIAAIELFKMYAIDTPCEPYVFKTVSPIDFKFERETFITFRTNVILFWAIC